MFKWVCLIVATAALACFGWMLNDIRLDIKGLTTRTEEQIPRLVDKADRVIAQLDQHMPRLLAQAEESSRNINAHLPVILQNAETATKAINSQLPAILANSEAALVSVTSLSDGFGQYKSLIGIVHTAKKNDSLLSYGTSLLGFLDSQPSVKVGLKKPGSTGLVAAMPAKDWSAAAKAENHFISLIGATKEDVLHGLARTGSAMSWHVQVAEAAPRPLAEWAKEVHPESKGVK